MQSNIAAASATALVFLAGLAVGRLWPGSRRFGSRKQNLKVATGLEYSPHPSSHHHVSPQGQFGHQLLRFVRARLTTLKSAQLTLHKYGA